MQNNKTFLPVSVLIPTMNRPEALKRTLQFLLSGSSIPAQIVIVDQSTNISVQNANREVISECAGQTECVYMYQETPSLTKARNTAYKCATQECLVMSDDDVDVYPDTLQNIYTIMQDKTVAMIAGIDDNTAKSRTNIGYLLGTKSFKNRKIGHVTLSMLGRYPDHITGEAETQWAMGYFFAVRKSLLEKWQITWDEKLTSYAYAEDLDFSFSYYKKAKAESLRCVLSENVRVKHLASKEYRIPSKKNTYMYVINRAYLIYKHNMGILSNVSMDWCNFWVFIRRVIKRENSSDMLKAIITRVKNSNEIKSGNLKNLY